MRHVVHLRKRDGDEHGAALDWCDPFGEPARGLVRVEMIARFGEALDALGRRHAARRDDEMVVAVALAARRVYALRREVEMRRAIDDERDLGAQQRTFVARELVAKERAERDAHEGRLVAVFGRIGQQRDSHVAADDFAEQFRRELVGEHHAAEPPADDQDLRGHRESSAVSPNGSRSASARRPVESDGKCVCRVSVCVFLEPSVGNEDGRVNGTAAAHACRGASRGGGAPVRHIAAAARERGGGDSPNARIASIRRVRRESMRPAHDCRNGLLARFGLGIDRGPSGIARSSVRPTGRA
ncbi:alpha/beta hydrolase family domain protein [Burkholderia pseudomallei MSHR5609]|nr:alpha/beta hydrolase family domain protein [Burkholderia pseudomallei MSHR5609]